MSGLPPLMTDDEVRAQEHVPVQRTDDDEPTQPPPDDGDSDSADDGWQPPTREEWEANQTLMQRAYELLESHRAELERQQGPIEIKEDDPWEQDEDLRDTDEEVRKIVTKQVMAVLRSAGINPDDFKRVKEDVGRVREVERFRAFDAERQTVRAAYGGAEVDKHDADVRKLMDTKPLSYEDAFLLVRAKKEKEARRSTASSQAAARDAKSRQAVGLTGIGHTPPAVINPVRKVSVTDIPPEKKRDMVSLMREIEARGDHLWESRAS